MSLEYLQKCRPITAPHLRANIDMNGVKAKFLFVERGYNNQTGIDITVNVISLPSIEGSLPWHIHAKPLTTKPMDFSCNSTAGHLDPNSVKKKFGDKYKCDKNNSLETCELGDLAGKFGSFKNIAGRYRYVDTDFSSIDDIKNLSVVIHNPDKSRLACANIY